MESDARQQQKGTTAQQGQGGESRTKEHDTKQQGAQEQGAKQQGAQEQTRDLAREFDALKRDLAQVRKDLTNLANAGRDTATGTASEARDRLEDEVRGLVNRLRDVSGSAMENEREMMDDMRRRVGDKPVTSMLTALGIGFTVGWLASRK